VGKKEFDRLRSPGSAASTAQGHQILLMRDHRNRAFRHAAL
jgi:hypothetical protein